MTLTTSTGMTAVTAQPAAPARPAVTPGRIVPVPVRQPVEERRALENPDTWHRVALGAVAALAALLYAWDLGNTPVQPYYAAAVRSMSESWRAFVYGGFDPHGFITVDKLPGALWPQAVSVWIFGYNQFAIHLPQIVEGVLAVLVLYRLVRLWAGELSALLAALVLALTPITVALNRVNISDTLLVLLLLLAAEATVRATRTGRTRTLLLAGVWVGLGFQAKMLQAWLVLPALGLTYLVAAPGKVTKRLGQLLVAGVVTLAASLSWAGLVAATPAQHRPYIDGTTNNSVFTLIFEYNGFSRFEGSPQARGVQPGRPAGRQAAPAHPAGNAVQRTAGGSHKADPPGPLRLFGVKLGPQIGWLLPFALLSLVCAPGRRRAGRLDLARGGFLLWGTWLLVHGLVFSVAEDVHPYYMAALAPAIAALSGVGFVLFWRMFRAGGARSWLLPLGVAGTGGWSAYLAYQYPEFSGWLVPVVLWLATVAVLILLWTRRSRATSRLVVAGAVLSVASLLSAPTVWAASTLVFPEDAQDPIAGPLTGDEQVRRAAPGFQRASARGLSEYEAEEMLRYLYRHHRNERYLVATVGIRLANRLLMMSGEDVLPIGGFTGNTPVPTTRQLEQMVRDGEVRFVLVQAQLPSAQPWREWVNGPGKCEPVLPTKYGENTFDPHIDPILYDCNPPERWRR